MSREEIKSTMSAKERAKRRASVGKAASDKIAKSEQLNFRIEEKSIKDLQEMAFKRGIPVGAMIRDWVLERLVREKLGTPNTADKALLVLDETYAKLKLLFGESAPSTKSGPVLYQNSTSPKQPKSIIREPNE